MPLVSFPSPGARWAARLGLIAYAALVSASLLTPAGQATVAGAGLFDLRTRARIRAVALGFAVYAVVEVLRFVPVGILAVLSLPRALDDRARMLLLAVAAGSGKPGHRDSRAHARDRRAMAGALGSLPSRDWLCGRRGRMPWLAGRAPRLAARA